MDILMKLRDRVQCCPREDMKTHTALSDYQLQCYSLDKHHCCQAGAQFFVFTVEI